MTTTGTTARHAYGKVHRQHLDQLMANLSEVIAAAMPLVAVVTC